MSRRRYRKQRFSYTSHAYLDYRARMELQTQKGIACEEFVSQLPAGRYPGEFQYASCIAPVCMERSQEARTPSWSWISFDWEFNGRALIHHRMNHVGWGAIRTAWLHFWTMKGEYPV